MNLSYLVRTSLNRCPACGKGPVLKNLFYRHENCEVCGFEFNREHGFFIGGIPISYGLICGLWIVPLLVLWFLNWVPTDWFVGLCLGGAFAWPVVSYRYCQSLWLGLYFCFAEDEMPKEYRGTKEETCP